MSKYSVKIDTYPIVKRSGYLYYVGNDGYIYETPMRHIQRKLMDADKKDQVEK